MATHARRHRPAESVFKTGIRDVAIVDIGGKRIVLHLPHHPAPTRNSAIIIRFGCTARGRHKSNDSRVMFLCVTTADTFDRPLRSMESDTKVFREFARRSETKKKKNRRFSTIFSIDMSKHRRYNAFRSQRSIYSFE